MTGARLAPDRSTPVSVLLGGVAVAAGAVGMVAVAALLLLVVTDVSLRFLLNQPLSGTIEYVAYWLMVPIGAFGAVVAHRHGDHIDVPLLAERLPGAAQRLLAVASAVLFAAFAATLAWYGALGALQHLDGETSGASGVQIAPTRWFVPAAMGVLALSVLHGLRGRDGADHE